MLRFFIFAVLAAVLIIVGVKATLTLGWISYQPSFFYQIVLLVFLTTLGLVAYLSRVDNPSFFVQFYLLTIAIKIVAYASFILIIVMKDRQGAAANVAVFMLSYVIFTSLAISFLYRRNERKNRS